MFVSARVCPGVYAELKTSALLSISGFWSLVSAMFVWVNDGYVA